MDSKRIEKLLLLIVVLLAINALVSFKPYQITGTGALVVYRLNVYTGGIVSFKYEDIPRHSQEPQP
jgi:hypothetical protein